MTGTQGFHGERLREAREARGLSVAQLAELVGVTKQAINLYERAKCSPAPDTFDRLCSQLRFPKRFLLRPPQPQPTGAVFYRSMKSATRLMRDRAERKFGWFRQLTSLLSQHVELPDVRLPDLNPPADPTRITPEQVEEAATVVRRHWGLGDGVISNVVLLLENHGIVANACELEADELDGFSNFDECTQRPFVVLGTEKPSQVRGRLSAGHELAHMVLHRGVPADLLKLPAVFNRMEEQAFHFARAFLLPKATFEREYVAPSLSWLKDLKQKWRVSVGTIIARAKELGQISSDQATRLWIKRTRHGWHRQEPFDDVWELERPVLVSKSVELVIESGTVSRAELLSHMDLYSEDLEAVAGLPPGYLREPDEESVEEAAPRLLPFPMGRAPRGKAN